MRINVLKGSTVRMSKHNLIIYSSASGGCADKRLGGIRRQRPRQTAGIFSPPTAPSVGHRPRATEGRSSIS